MVQDQISTWMKEPVGHIQALLKFAESNAQHGWQGHRTWGSPSSLVNSWNVFLSLEGSVRQLLRDCVGFDVSCAAYSQHTRANRTWVCFTFHNKLQSEHCRTDWERRCLEIVSVIAGPIRLIRVCLHVTVPTMGHCHSTTSMIAQLESEFQKPSVVVRTLGCRVLSGLGNDKHWSTGGELHQQEWFLWALSRSPLLGWPGSCRQEPGLNADSATVCQTDIHSSKCVFHQMSLWA